MNFRKSFTALLICTATLTFAQTTRTLGDFSSLKVYDKINVVLVSSATAKVEISADEADVETVNKNGELKIRMVPLKVMQGDHVTVKVFYRALNDVQASQGAVITAQDEIKTRMLSLVSNEGSKITVSLTAKTVKAKLNSGGEIHIQGKSVHQDVVVNSGAGWFARELSSENASVTANAGGFAEVDVSGSVNATTRAGGTIHIYGDPEDRTVKNVIGGKIEFK